MAGESAQQEFERRRARRLDRLRDPRVRVLAIALIALSFVFGALVPMVPSFIVGAGKVDFGLPSLLFGGVMAAGTAVQVLAPPQSETAWRRGAEGERIVAHALDALTSSGARVLHDRRMPRSRANIDHLVVTSGGVVTVDAKRYVGKLEARRRGRELWIAGRNRSKLLDQARRQAEAVSAALREEGLGTTPVRATLCFVDTQMPWLFAPRAIGDVLITTPRTVGDRLAGPDHLSPGQVEAVTRALDRRLPSASSPRAASGRQRTARRPVDAVPTTSAPDRPCPTCACGASMVRRTRRSDGAAFYGCSTFPQCRRTRQRDDEGPV